MTRAVVVGGTGFLGRQVVAALSGAGWDVTVLSRQEKPCLEGTRVVTLDERAPRRAQFAGAIGTLEPDVVINTAGVRWLHDESKMWAANARLPEQLVTAMADARSTARLVHLGSSLEYMPLPQPEATDECCPTTPQGVYGMTKLHGTERVLEGWPNVVVLRVFNAIGAGMSPSSLLGCTLRALLSPRGSRNTATISLQDNMSQYRDYVDARDVADAVLAAAEHREVSFPRPAIVNIGSAVATRAEDVVRGLADVSDVDYEIVTQAPEEDGNRPPDVGWQVADTSRAARMLGWSATRGLTDTLRWIWRTASTG